MTTPPVACTLSADELRTCAEHLLPGLARVARNVSGLPTGVRLEFEAAPGIVSRIAAVVERERACCSFLCFAVEIPASDAPVARSRYTIS